MVENAYKERATRLAKALLDMYQDPLLKAYTKLTKDQSAWLRALQREKVLEGGNQSGKSWVASVNFLLQALGLHPTINVKGGWVGWYATTTFELFSEQIWKHWKALLMWPDENIYEPTRRILKVGWLKKNPETPNYLALRRFDGSSAEIRIKSYAQGREEFQSAAVDLLALDEEAPDEMYEEAQPRVVGKGGQIAIVATPVEGVAWLTDLRLLAESSTEVYHGRLDTRDNPGLQPAALAGLVKRYEDNSDLMRLRLMGYPVAEEGCVYPDTIFRATRDGKPWHVCEPFHLPREDWDFYRVIDPGLRYCACLWLAQNREGYVVIYRDYLGENRTTYENAKHIYRVGKREMYQECLIDSAVMGRDQTTGERQIDIWREAFARVWGNLHGYRVATEGLVDLWLQHEQDLTPTSRKDVLAGIEIVQTWLQQEVNGIPKLRVFDRCKDFLRERKLYRWPPKPKESRTARDPRDMPLKRWDHTMDCLRYFALERPEIIDVQPQHKYPTGSRGLRFKNARRRGVKRW